MQEARTSARNPLTKSKHLVFVDPAGVVRLRVQPNGEPLVERAARLLAVLSVRCLTSPRDFEVFETSNASFRNGLVRQAEKLIKESKPLSMRTTQLRGAFRLTPREGEVLELLLNGACNKDIATKLNISYRVTKFHVSNLFRKFRVSGRSDLMIRSSNYFVDGRAKNLQELVSGS